MDGVPMSEGPSAYTERTEGPSTEQTDSSGVLVMSPSSRVWCRARWWCRWNDWRWGEVSVKGCAGFKHAQIRAGTHGESHRSRGRGTLRGRLTV
ncbi:hypothetical protein E2C01_049620 [Portunus trituberculatus]|uniref:Uncharacterized protein n=1 Tax=Portunus trituberculatus TaxID=210409 RepID=A0A5B7GEV3_PORTR|nr:hypothetical protein [Portunus trituberculatus]